MSAVRAFLQKRFGMKGDVDIVEDHGNDCQPRHPSRQGSQLFSPRKLLLLLSKFAGRGLFCPLCGLAANIE